jgi:diguanylate cyclase (GGDEF)-like protein
MSDPLDSALLALQQEYLASLPLRLKELSADIAALGRGEAEAVRSLRDRLHKLAGSGGSYGFTDLSAIAREGERWLAANPGSNETAKLDSLVERLQKAVQGAQGQLRGTAAGQATAPPPRACIIMRSSPQRERIAQELRSAGYEVLFASRQDDPRQIAIEQLPHLLVIGGEVGDGDLSAIASNWTSVPERRPGAVVLVETLRPVDRLRAVAAGVDAVFPADQVEQKLPRYARTFARIGPPPSNVVLVDHEPARAARSTAALESAHIRVTSCGPSQSVSEALERGSPDVVLLSTRLANSDAFALARIIRLDPRYHLLPIVFVGSDTTAERLAALRAGADDFVSSDVEPGLLIQTVIARAARGRRIREMVHRDGLTGLLNHATLLAELEGAVDFSQRYGEPLAFVLFEIAGFKSLAERLGPRAGDEVLLHAAGVFRSNVRASDVIGRYGGEAFGMLLRGASAGGASVLAQNLHRALGEQPARTSGGEVVQLDVKVGTAVFPRDGATAAELAQAADRSLRSGEAGKRVSGNG